MAASLAAIPGFAGAQSQNPAAAKSAVKSGAAPAGGDAASRTAAAKKTDPATTQSTIEAAAKLLESGKTDQAVAALTGVIAGGNLPPVVMARALYLRGAAYRKQSKPALAISDLTSALWLKGGLADADRKDALQQRAAAYSEAGLTDQGQNAAASAGGAALVPVDGTAREPKQRPQAAAAESNTGTAAKSGGFFGGLFGGSTSAPAPAPAKDDQSTGAWSNAVTASKPAQAPAAVAAPAIVAAATAPSRARMEGQYRSRVALVRTKAEAEAVVVKLKTQYAAVLANHVPEIGEATFGNMGSFFQVRVGPFESAAEAQAICCRLKGSGLDCVPVDR